VTASIYHANSTKESFDTGATDDPLYNNVWPPADSIPGFKEFMEHFYAMCQELHITILTALERGFLSRGIDVDLLTPCADNVSEMRLNYYPPIVRRIHTPSSSK
jgi:isopenicillin N synthase-like dioxygenase